MRLIADPKAVETTACNPVFFTHCLLDVTTLGVVERGRKDAISKFNPVFIEPPFTFTSPEE